MDEKSGLQNFPPSAHIEFLAEDEEILITPNFSLDALHFISVIIY
jgi:hypothetical protein